MTKATLLFLAGLALPLAAGSAPAAGPTVVLTLRNHRYEPSVITVPAGQRVHVHLVNQDGAAEEFDSSDMGVEEDVTPHGVADFSIGPLRPGGYAFMGEAHPATAEGRITAVAAAR